MKTKWYDPCLIQLPKVWWPLTGEQEERLMIVKIPGAVGGIELFLWPLNTWRKKRVEYPHYLPIEPSKD